jgi:hypothetical protein
MSRSNCAAERRQVWSGAVIDRAPIRKQRGLTVVRIVGPHVQEDHSPVAGGGRRLEVPGALACRTL